MTSPIKVVGGGTPTTDNLANGQIAIENVGDSLVIHGNVGGKVVKTGAIRVNVKNIVGLISETTNWDCGVEFDTLHKCAGNGLIVHDNDSGMEYAVNAVVESDCVRVGPIEIYKELNKADGTPEFEVTARYELVFTEGDSVGVVDVKRNMLRSRLVIYSPIPLWLEDIDGNKQVFSDEFQDEWQGYTANDAFQYFEGVKSPEIDATLMYKDSETSTAWSNLDVQPISVWNNNGQLHLKFGIRACVDNDELLFPFYNLTVSIGTSTLPLGKGYCTIYKSTLDVPLDVNTGKVPKSLLPSDLGKEKRAWIPSPRAHHCSIPVNAMPGEVYFTDIIRLTSKDAKQRPLFSPDEATTVDVPLISAQDSLGDIDSMLIGERKYETVIRKELPEGETTFSGKSVTFPAGLVEEEKRLSVFLKLKFKGYWRVVVPLYMAKKAAVSAVRLEFMGTYPDEKPLFPMKPGETMLIDDGTVYLGGNKRNSYEIEYFGKVWQYRRSLEHKADDDADGHPRRMHRRWRNLKRGVLNTTEAGVASGKLNDKYFRGKRLYRIRKYRSDVPSQWVYALYRGKTQESKRIFGTVDI